MTFHLPRLLLLSLLTAGCARPHFFQSDARLRGAPPLAPTADSAQVTAGRHYQTGAFHKVFFGPHYRALWAMPVVLPVLNLRTAVPGGLRPGKMGGGFQTISMTVRSPDGRSYALRSVDKDPLRTLPKILQKSFVLNVVRDATSAAQPYGSLVVPPLAAAAGVLHTTPRLFYVRADETGLGDASERYQGKVVLLEEKFEGKENLTPALQGATNLVETDDMLARRYGSSKNQIDQAAFLRARLLDLWLGDWDRHEGQWSWASFPQADEQIRWRPIPQDRDQVFFRFDDGLIPWLMSRRWAVAKFRTFRPHFESIEGYTRNARFIDQRALSEMPRAQYVTIASDLQARLTDAVIEAAARRLPPPVYAREGRRLVAALWARRARLPQAAAAFYRLQAREVVVAGTDEEERFVVERLNDTTTVVSVYALTDSKELAPLLYRRAFHPRDTRTVVLHGLGGKDLFELSGKVRRSPRIDIYGGPDEDTVDDKSRVAGLRKKTRFFDTRRNNVLNAGLETKNKTTRGVDSHAFDRDGSGR